MEIKENKNYYDAAMHQINGDSLCLSTYQYLKKNEEWAGRYEDFLKGKKSLPLLYDPFFKKIFNPTERRDRLSELVSCLLGQKVTVLEVFPNEDSQFLGVMIIMDMVVLMADGSIANIEIQKISYDFPAERISCYSADLVLRQYKMITGKNQVGKHELSMNGSSKPSYKDMRKVHTIILFEDSNKSLISDMDKALYFHVGKTKFNTGIKIELLQDFVLVSLDTFRKYRYSDIKEGRTEITDYDYDSSQYNDALVSEKMKRDRLKFLSLFVAETPQEIDKLVETFPDLESVRQDINEYLERPGEVLSMFSEALRILDRNTAELMVDRMKDEIVDLREQNDELTGRIDELEEQTYGLKAEKEELTVHTDKLEAENNALKVSSDQKDAEIARLKKLLEEQNK
ncbi:hypothetical protein LK414_02270 (plasmid) [Lachnospira eligens]|uniref:PD-(D/E)XK nuclease family transposase n=1 Tax=Lachnospira eligens (strain ATCC 27750 / DSM 3376 / VPI C15-48 / C15-B4) TaxID=515620 RepID=C4Z651_LACE2|nr:hypothetical protein [Lachnospira eligens]ACR73443.1 Hypothetical protein EUBELI_20298 [[Eubacterium] eligens ATCC 27750]UEA96314.1 hypothetical protein LK414_02270 [Lachnospira eligens]